MDYRRGGRQCFAACGQAAARRTPVAAATGHVSGAGWILAFHRPGGGHGAGPGGGPGGRQMGAASQPADGADDDGTVQHGGGRGHRLHLAAGAACSRRSGILAGCHACSRADSSQRQSVRTGGAHGLVGLLYAHWKCHGLAAWTLGAAGDQLADLVACTGLYLRLGGLCRLAHGACGCCCNCSRRSHCR